MLALISEQSRWNLEDAEIAEYHKGNNQSDGEEPVRLEDFGSILREQLRHHDEKSDGYQDGLQRRQEQTLEYRGHLYENDGTFLEEKDDDHIRTQKEQQEEPELLLPGEQPCNAGYTYPARIR